MARSWRAFGMSCLCGYTWVSFSWCSLFIILGIDVYRNLRECWMLYGRSLNRRVTLLLSCRISSRQWLNPVTLFAFVIIFSNMMLGLFIGAGAFTRLCALLAMGLTLFNYLLFFPTMNQQSWAVGIMLFVILLTGAGRCYGLDHKLQNDFPKWLI